MLCCVAEQPHEDAGNLLSAADKKNTLIYESILETRVVYRSCRILRPVALEVIRCVSIFWKGYVNKSEVHVDVRVCTMGLFEPLRGGLEPLDLARFQPVIPR